MGGFKIRCIAHVEEQATVRSEYDKHRVAKLARTPQHDRFGASAVASACPAIALGGADLRAQFAARQVVPPCRAGSTNVSSTSSWLRELFQPVALQPPPRTRQNPRGEVQIIMAGQNQKTRIVLPLG